MSHIDLGSGLRGRRGECEALDRLVAGVRAGHSQVVVLHGEAGVGKTALLDYLVLRSAGFRTSRAAGIESEMEIPFAGLHQFCMPFLGRLERLPSPQREALGTVFGLRSGSAPDRFLVGLAVLSLLSDVAEEQPLVCVIDDVQWLDLASRQTLAFVARRLLAEAVGMVFAVREGSEDQGLDGLVELQVRGLGDEDARALLDSVIAGPLDERVRDRIVAETRGNPLALLELPRGLSPAELAGGFGLLTTLPLAGRIERGFLLRLEPLPIETRWLLLTAAAEPVGDVALLWRAVERLGIQADAAGPAEAARLIEIGARVRFRHPLVRSAAYRAADPRDLRDVHHALGEATDEHHDPDRRAWHHARATVKPDASVADELERSAGRAQARGGIAAAAAFLAQAAELTPDPSQRGARALAAAQAKFDASAPESALQLLASAKACPLDALQQALSDRLHAQLTFARRRGSGAPSLSLLLDAARKLEPLDAGLARDTYLEALRAGVFAGKLGDPGELRRVAVAARAAPAGPDGQRAADLLLDGLSTRFTDGYAAAVPPLKRALQAFALEGSRHPEDVRWLWLAWPVAYEVWDDEVWHQLSTRLVSFARDLGALTILPLALVYRAQLHVQAGQLDAAAGLLEEVEMIKEATASTPLMYTSTTSSASLVIAAWRGQEARALELIDDSIQEGAVRGEGRAISLAEFSRAVLYNGLGRYDAALVAAERVCEHDDLALFAWGLVELIEASVRAGLVDRAAAALLLLEERTRAAGTDWALGTEARCRALLSHGEAADRLHREAIERLGRTRIRVGLARAHLLYGEWLRREGRRVAAREQLRTAHGMLSEIGMEAFAERARRELLATGETVRRRSVETRVDLTPQEGQIARLAADGSTNPEIAVTMFISARTVEWHLHKVFGKLGVSSRRQLRGALVESGRTAARA
jgi:DNA-binding CsgD family transcriptional regulator/tetratricopeptide (TPR) repeat protein